MYILGLNGFLHDSSAALMEDGKVIACVEEERFSRVKHTGAFPHKAIDFVLQYAGIKLQDVDHIAYYFDQGIIFRKFWRFQPYFNKLIIKPWKFFGALYLLKMNDQQVVKLAKKANAKLHFVEHHLCHAASAFYGSDFNKANILTIDGRGEIVSTLFGCGHGSEIEKLNEIPLPHSLGVVYSCTTQFLGFRPNHDEGKVMGLAPYGKDRFHEQFRKMVWPTRDGFRMNTKYFWGQVWEWGAGKEQQTLYTQEMVRLLGKPRIYKTQEPINNHYEHIAASLQKRTEDIGVHLARLLYEKTGYKDLCLAGGVVLNAKMNGIIHQQDFVDNLYIQAAAADNGASLGAAMFVYNKLTGKRPEPIEHVFLGSSYTNQEIKKLLDKCKVSYKKSSDIGGDVAELLAKNKIVGWFQGRMEVGPRALGSRSILVNPQQEKMKDSLNLYVKNREWWRPFALSMLNEVRKKYLVHDFYSPFMILIDDVRKERQKEVAAGVHVDGTTRPQTLLRKHNQLYYDMIKNFGKETGTPVVLNTSFNLAGEPLVETPDQAIKDFYGSGMDYLALGDYLLEK